MKVTHHDLPAYWAPVLINNDTSGLTRNPMDLEEFEAWAKENPELRNPVNCGNHEFVGHWNGQFCSMLTYGYLTD